MLIDRLEMQWEVESDLTFLTPHKGVSRWLEKGNRPIHIFRGLKKKGGRIFFFFLKSRQGLWICQLVTVLLAADGEFDSGMKHWAWALI